MPKSDLLETLKLAREFLTRPMRPPEPQGADYFGLVARIEAAIAENLPPENLPGQSALDYDEDMTNSERATGPHCHIHPDTALTCARCIGAKGGKSRSKKKLAAIRKNAKLGGRPKGSRNRPKNLPASPDFRGYTTPGE